MVQNSASVGRLCIAKESPCFIYRWVNRLVRDDCANRTLVFFLKIYWRNVGLILNCFHLQDEIFWNEAREKWSWRWKPCCCMDWEGMIGHRPWEWVGLGGLCSQDFGHLKSGTKASTVLTFFLPFKSQKHSMVLCLPSSSLPLISGSNGRRERFVSCTSWDTI